MILHNAGKYNGDESTLPHRENPSNAVPFKEVENMEKLSLIANTGAALTMIVEKGTVLFSIFLKKLANNNQIYYYVQGAERRLYATSCKKRFTEVLFIM